MYSKQFGEGHSRWRRLNGYVGIYMLTQVNWEYGGEIELCYFLRLHLFLQWACGPYYTVFKGFLTTWLYSHSRTFLSWLVTALSWWPESVISSLLSEILPSCVYTLTDPNCGALFLGLIFFSKLSSGETPQYFLCFCCICFVSKYITWCAELCFGSGLIGSSDQGFKDSQRRKWRNFLF